MSWDRNPFDNYDNKVSCYRGTELYIVDINMDEDYAAVVTKDKPEDKYFLRLGCSARNFTIDWDESLD